jgi:hypothetical protein
MSGVGRIEEVLGGPQTRGASLLEIWTAWSQDKSAPKIFPVFLFIQPTNTTTMLFFLGNLFYGVFLLCFYQPIYISMDTLTIPSLHPHRQRRRHPL